ncbi:MAG: ribosomal protein S18-alanine N-acetyltransferase [Candidatus Atabeyarchaeum deiterrae]
MVREDNPLPSEPEGTGVKIRLFKISDLHRVLEIERGAFPDAWDESWFVYFFQTNPNGFFVAVDHKNHVVGYAVVDIEGGQDEAWTFMDTGSLPPARGHLLNVAVDKEWRGKGIGTALIGGVNRYLVDRGVNELWLEVRTSNADAIRLYKRQGFEETGRVMRNYYPDGGDALVMRKNLTG